jgi:prolyl-tRNA synthetase
MKYSQLFTKTSKNFPADETSKNAQLLIKAGFIHKSMAGVYSYLPLGLRVINKIENIVRKNLNQIGGQEILMNALHPKEWWLKTDRWDAEKVDVLFRLQSQTKSEYALACSHEEQVTPICKDFINSYQDLPDYTFNSETGESQFPLSVYQVQTKFRDELRSKSGMMRGREFRMKDMYAFHTSEESVDSYYNLAKETYLKIYQEIGLKAYAVHATGGMFTDNDSHEFQVVCQAGEDVIFYNDSGYAINEDIKSELEGRGESIPSDLQSAKSAEVGNIFKLGDKYSKAFDLKYTSKTNESKPVLMTCYGIGTSRCMGVIAEEYSDENGLKWPKSVSPFDLHIVTHYSLKDETETIKKIKEIAELFYNGTIRIMESKGVIKLLDLNNRSHVQDYVLSDLITNKPEAFWDDRTGKVGFGEKLKDADLMGMPYQVIITRRTLENSEVEIKRRSDGQTVQIKIVVQPN